MKEEYDLSIMKSRPNPYGAAKRNFENEEIIVRKLTDEEGGGYLAEYTPFKGCIADGETKIEALKALEKAKESWLLTANEFGIEVPKNSKK